nr:hypothetical transcript [Hymenolepis microstoma]
MKLGYTCSEEVANASAMNSRQNSQKSTDSSQNFNYEKHLLVQNPNISVKLKDFEERSNVSHLDEQKNEIKALQYQINDSNRYLESPNELEDSKGESNQDYLRRDEECTKHSSEIPPMLDEIIQQLHAVLSYFQSESSLYSGTDVCEIIRNLLVHFENIQTMKNSLISTEERTFSRSPDNERNDISSMTTTIGNLRSDLIEIDVDHNISDLSTIETKNRKIIDQVTVAMAEIQDVVDDSSVRAATEVLTALTNGGYGDCKTITKYDRDRRLPRTLTRTRNRDPSIDVPTDNACRKESLGPSRLPRDSDFEVILTRFVDVMARMHILAFDLEANANRDQPQLASSGEIIANSEDGQKSFSNWAQKAHEWFQKFVFGLRDVSLLSEMAEIQDVVDDSSVRAATEVLTALTNGGYGDCKTITKYDRDRRLPRTLTRTRNRDPSIDVPTDNACRKESLGPSRLPRDSDFEVILTRFVDVMARMHILAFDLEANANRDQPQLASSGEIIANSEDGQKSFSNWAQKAHEWFQKFVFGLRDVSLLSEVEADLESLESEFVNNYSALYEKFKKLGNRETLDVIKRKCGDLESLNNELECVRVQLSNTLEMERQEHEKEVSELRSTCDQLKSDLEHSKQIENDLQEQLTDTNGSITNLLSELDQSNEMVTHLQNRLDKAETELSFHQSELHKLKSRAKKFIKIDVTDVPSVLTIFDSFENEMKTQIQMAEQKRKQDEEERLYNLNESYEIKINDMKNELHKVVEQYELKVREFEKRYENLREKLKSQQLLSEENSKNGASREKKLISELRAKIAESEHLREGIYALQDEADTLRRKFASTKRAAGEELVKRAKKYPELKVIANDLKLRLVKSAELLEHSVAEAKRLRKIIHANDSKSNELLKELERLRAIILVKNSKIHQLEDLALHYTSSHLEASPERRMKLIQPLESHEVLRNPSQISNQSASVSGSNRSINQRPFQELGSDTSKWSFSTKISQAADEDLNLNLVGRQFFTPQRAYLVENPVVEQIISVVDFDPRLEEQKNSRTGAKGDAEKALSINSSGDASSSELPLSIDSPSLPLIFR